MNLEEYIHERIEALKGESASARNPGTIQALQGALAELTRMLRWLEQ